MTQVVEAKPGLVTAEMRRAVPGAAYPCAGGCGIVYPADMIGYIESKDAWVCAVCAAEDDVFWLGFHWDENDEPAYRVALWLDLPAPTHKLPDPRYACSWGDCGAERTFPASELRFLDSGSVIGATPEFKSGFFCPWHYRHLFFVSCLRWAYRPTLAEVLEVLADLERAP